MSLLDSIHSPEDLTGLTRDEMDQLADEIRQFLVAKVSATGGHLGPNLGVVELTLAIHRVFDSPSDPVIFDTGHQCYVHKIITGRADGFDELRQRDGLTGYQERAESPHDWVESSHASAALSYADGLSKAFELRGEHRTVVAVVGDGALTGGMCWEALNNIAAARRPVVIVINDNGRSYAPTIGGLAQHLAGLRLQPGYERILEEGRKLIKQMPVVGEPAYAVMHGMKSGIKDLLAPQALFADLGLKYVGPVDGHDTAALEAALRHEMGKELYPSADHRRNIFVADKLSAPKEIGVGPSIEFLSQKAVEERERKQDFAAIFARVEQYTQEQDPPRALSTRLRGAEAGEDLVPAPKSLDRITALLELQKQRLASEHTYTKKGNWAEYILQRPSKRASTPPYHP